MPLVNELGAKGLPTMRKEAEAAGQVVGTELSQAVDAAADQMTALKTQAQILGAQFFLGLAPELRRSLGMISGDLKDSGKDWREYGRQVGEVLPGLVLVFGTAFDFIASGIRRLGQRIAGLAIQTVSAVRVMNLEATGQSARAEAEREIARKVVEEIGAQMEAEEKARLERMNRRSAEAARLRGQLRGESGEAGWHPPMARPPERADLRGLEVDSQQILALQKASIDNEISLLKAKNQLRNEEEKQAFAEGLQNVREFYADRRRILEEAVAAEIAALLQKKVLLVGEENESKRKKESAAIDAQIAQLSIEAATERLQLAGEEKKEIQSLGEDRLALEKRLLELQGNRHAAAMLDIEAEIRKVSEDLTAAGDPKREALVASLRRMLESKEAFEETLRQADAAMADLELARGQIQAKVEAGLMSELDGERALLLVEQDRMKALRDIAEKLMAAAAATGDPELVRQAEEFSNALIGVGVRVSDLDLQIQHLGQSIRGALTGELADFFSDGITQAANFGEAVKSLALSIVQSIRRIVSELIAAQIVKGLFGLFGGGGQVGGGKVLAAGGLIRKAPIRRFSAGGYLRGPGTGTSDSLVGITEGGRPARFSAGEFVTREAVVRQPGALDFLEAFNRAGMAAIRDVSPRVSAASLPRFAEGGLVRGGTAPGTSRGGHLKISLDRGLIMETLESPEGQRVLVQSAYRNRRAMQAAQRE
ncbi:MAG: hypothetical protein A2Y38_13040 [Spirochaetes bacterium GWB1_59_5]|nr:MAG: hypothetical protein A2Y38_13040 [Spirochaetes bacterium GWB1_59_5]